MERDNRFMFMLMRRLTILPLLAAGLLAGCGGVPGLSGGEFGSVSAQADLASVVKDLAKHRIAETPEGLWVRQLPEIPREKMATVLSYRAMDNDLAGDLVKHLNDLEEAGSSAYANLLVFSDADGQDDTRLHYMVQDSKRAIASPWLHAEGPLRLTGKELNSASPETLERFVGWGFREYPGRFKLLDVSSHGSGYQGMCVDFTSNYAQMPLHSFGTAVRQGLKGRQLDVLNLLACLMSTVEVAYEFRDVAKVMVASEDLIMGGRVLPYSQTFGRLSARSDWQKADAQDVARQLVEDARPDVPASGAYTMAALDLSQIADVKRQLNVLSNLLLERLPANRREILAAYDGVPVLRKDKGQSSHRDLIRFAQELQTRVSDPEIRKAAGALITSCERTILVAKRKKMERDVANGLSVYLPDPYEEFNAAYRETRLAKESSWDEFLLAVKASR
ncbi:Clostripain precursor [compost metagenome]